MSIFQQQENKLSLLRGLSLITAQYCSTIQQGIERMTKVILQMNIPVSRIRFNPDRHDRQRKQMGEREGGSGPERTGEL